MAIDSGDVGFEEVAREYEAEVAAKLEVILREKKRARREKLVPVADFAEV